MQFNFNNMSKCISSLDEAANESYPTNTIEDMCSCLRNELNKFAPDFLCKEVIFTPNTDKQFFGIYIRPLWNSAIDFAKAIMAGYSKNFGISDEGNIIDFERFKPDKYIIELDGKLFRSFNLSPMEVCAIIIKEVMAMNSAEPVEKLRSIIDTYVSMTNDNPCTQTIQDTAAVFEMACAITLHNITSIFCSHDTEDFVITADHVLSDTELSNPYKNAISKIMLNAKPDDADTTAMMIGWYFTHYKQIKMSRDFQYMIKNCMEIEASKIIRTMLLLSLRSIENLTYGDEKYYGQLLSESTKKKGLLYQMKKNGLRSIEEDLFEYNMRLRNVETQDDAILLMRQINSRMSILEEYLDNEELDEKDRKRWEDCYKKYLELRDSLSKKTVYNRKMYGLFVDYNALQNMSSNGNLMNIYY